MLEAKLKQVCEKYAQEFDSNPTRLRSAIPAQDIWRFFVEERVQQYGSGLSLKPHFESYYKSHLTLTLDAIQNNLDTEKKQSEEKQLQKFKDKNSGESNGYYRSEEYENYKKYIISQPSLKKDLDSLRLFLFTKNHSNHSAEDEERQKRFTLNELLLLDKAWMTFEWRTKEPGYLEQLYKAFQKVFEFIVPLSIQLIYDFHKLSITNVLDNEPGEFKKDLNIFGITRFNSTKEGLISLSKKNKPYLSFVVKEIMDEWSSEVNEFLIECNENNIDTLYGYTRDPKYSVRIYSDFQNRNEVIQEMQKRVNHYNENIIQTNNPLEKLKVIIKFIQDSVQLHPFKDGNCRTFVMLLLNYLLIQNGFPLTLLKDANRFGAYSTEELIEEVINGMENVFEIIETKKLFGLSSEEILADMKTVKQPEAEIAVNLFNKLIKIENDNRCKKIANEKGEENLSQKNITDAPTSIKPKGEKNNPNNTNYPTIARTTTNLFLHKPVSNKVKIASITKRRQETLAEYFSLR